MSPEDRKGLMRTYSGMYVNPLFPTVAIRDIAWGLAGIPRYGGQSPWRYTVAQHSVDVMLRVERGFWRESVEHNSHELRLMLEALLHDAHEAYFGDDILPKKNLIPGLKALEDKCQTHVLAQLGVTTPLNALVKIADGEALDTELAELWRTDGANIWGVDEAYEKFLDCYYRLTAALDAAIRREAK